MATGSRISWGKLLLFYALAFAVSALFNSGLLTPQYEQLTKDLMIKKWPFLPAGIGTLIAAMLAFRFDNRLSRTISLAGTNRRNNLLIALVPTVVFTCAGVHNSDRINAHYYGLAFSFIALLYALSEEIFWRGYLVDALRPINKIASIVLIGAAWWAWHFRFATGFDFTGFLLLCMISSFLLYQFADETKSCFTAAGLHSAIIVATSEGWTQASAVSLGITIGLWIIIRKLWKTRDDPGRKRTGKDGSQGL